jgi:ribosome recycling factor
MENIIRVYRPELTEEERAKRMKAIKEAAERLIVAAHRKEHTYEHHHHQLER